jgi:ribonucleotide reductase alpha subunit
MTDWSNLAAIVTRRTYARKDTGKLENWQEIIERTIMGNVKGHNVPEQEVKDLLRFGIERKAIPAGRGLWFSGSPAHAAIGGVALNNCWYLNSIRWENFVRAQDLLMLGGGVGMSVEHRFTSKLPKVKKDVKITHKHTKDADFIVPDSREGWCELTRRVMESYFVTGKSFCYSTYCLRGSGELIKGFGGLASGPIPLIQFVSNLSSILNDRAGNHIRPIDAADIVTCTGEMVVSGNVRRSAIIILGDCWDKEYLKAKRWDLGLLPSYRSCANYSVVCDDYDDLHPLFWKTFEQGEAFGIINRKAIQKFGRMGESKSDSAEGVNPCVSGDTLVLTSKGYLSIESLIDKEIMVWNGFEWSKVRPKITGEQQPLLAINFSSGQSLTCTPHHVFVVSTDYKGGTKKVKAENLKIGMKLIKTNFPILDNEKIVSWAYTQGFISAEGMDDYNYFYVYPEKSGCLDRLGYRNIRKADASGRVALYPNFDKLPKSFVPFEWGLKSRLDWLAGLMDGDGTVTLEGGVQVSSINKKFLLELQMMLTTCGIMTKINKDEREGMRSLPDGCGGYKDYYCQDLYRLMICSEDVQNLIKIGLVCERLKILNFKPNRNASRFNQVVQISDAGIADFVYCFNEPLRHLGCFNGVVTGQCGEATLEPNEPCNLQEIALPNLESEEEFIRAAVLMHRYGKRVTMEKYHHEEIQEVIDRNRRVGTGITGCLASSLFTPDILDRAYEAIQKENVKYSKELGIPKSIRTTVIKPSGTVSKVLDMNGYEGIHAAYSRYIIQRIRFAANDSLIPLLRNAGHRIEPVKKLDGTLDHGTLVVDFYVKAPDGSPVADEDWDTWKQLDIYKMAQKHWSDQSVSVSVYYNKNEINKIKDWVQDNLKEVKSISFLCHNDHGFAQAPKEKITKEQFEQLSEKIKPIDIDRIDEGDGLDGLECEGGICPVK